MINNHIFEPNEDFDFSKLSLGQPAAIQGGSYFTKLLYDKHPFYIQTPKGFTRGGFVKNGKKILESYSAPFDMKKFNSKWITTNEELFDLADARTILVI